MSKAKHSSPLPGKDATTDLRELIVVTQSDAGIVATPEAVVSRTGKKVSSLNSLLKSKGAKMLPLFGPENRIATSKRGQPPSPESVATLVGYYKVEVAGNLDKIRDELLNDVTVAGAYIKPAAEPPVMNEAAPIGGETPPATPNFTASQLYLGPAPGGIDALFAWTLPGGKGDGVGIIDVEGAWRFSHEDLIANQGGVIGGTQSTEIGWRNHGTAVAGEFGGDENGFGITGICPNANLRAISIFGNGQSSANAIRQAADALNAGDIILIELHRPGPRFAFAGRPDQRGYIAVEWWPDDFVAIKYATGRGIIVVQAGGNGAEDLDDAIYNKPATGFPPTWTNPFNIANLQSGAIIVGAGAPPIGTHGRNNGNDRSRLDFSNWGSRIDVQGWGREVTTCGYGDLQGGPNEDFWYTDTFSGTSSASPIIVGVIGCIQGRLRARKLPLLNPASATKLLRTTGSAQQDTPGRPASQRIGNRPDLKQAFDDLKIGVIQKLVTEVKNWKEGKDKEVKEVIKFVKDKEGKDWKETKETKEGKDKEWKEWKENKETKEWKEWKETKEGKDKEMKETKEDKETKEGKDIKETKEGKDGKDKEGKDGKDKELKETVENFFGNYDAGSSGLGEVESRILNLENAVNKLTHFINSNIRPDLQSTLFGNTTDIEKNAYDSKQQKDFKDTREF